MIEFNKKNGVVILSYSSEQGESSWVIEKLRERGEVRIAGVFWFTEDELLNENNKFSYENEIKFKVAEIKGEYFCFPKKVLNLKHNLYIHKDIRLDKRLFIAERKISIFKKIDDIINQSIYIGGTAENNIPNEVFSRLLKLFPNTYELNMYANSRIFATISSYLDITDNHEEKYHRYLNTKESYKGVNLTKKFAELEYIKFSSILKKLKSMLANENLYNEAQWQKELIQIIPLVYPKYLYVFDEAPILDEYKNTTRKVDYLLIDSSGNIDIAEIKKPFAKCILTEGEYRDNHVPLRELSGAIMQVEKYIFHLNRSGKKGENKIKDKYKAKLPADFEIKVTNPGGIIIMGRSLNLSPTQKQDFEVIKRKYKNIIDIITYDDLIERLKQTIKRWEKKSC